MTEVACPSCGGGERARWRGPRGRSLVRCRGCGLVYANRIPEADEHAQAVGESAVYTNDQLAKRAFFRRRAHELLEAIERIQGRPGRLLDVGCGIGTELEVARDRGWQAKGIELSAASLRVARSHGLDVVGTPLAEAGLSGAAFDCVTVNHALEHIPHVRPMLAEVRRVLRPSGLLFVSVPNVGAWPHRVGAHRLGLAFNDDHYLFFTPATLDRLLRRSGFTVMGITTPRWLDFQRGPASTYRAPFRAVNAVVERLRLGLEIFALARVP
jgi:2-polyprenyl-3-methyl-5-hydroxy-6-metoxy-1,4-benzoquinol methylase